MDDLVCRIELRSDGVVVVRVPPARHTPGCTLPDAVFSFRVGDPQYGYWRSRWYLEHAAPHDSNTAATAEVA